MFRMLGYCCYAFAVVDLGTYYLGIANITGMSWSPVAAAVLGSVLVKMDGKQQAVETVETTGSHENAAEPGREVA